MRRSDSLWRQRHDGVLPPGVVIAGVRPDERVLSPSCSATQPRKPNQAFVSPAPFAAPAFLPQNAFLITLDSPPPPNVREAGLIPNGVIFARSTAENECGRQPVLAAPAASSAERVAQTDRVYPRLPSDRKSLPSASIRPPSPKSSASPDVFAQPCRCPKRISLAVGWLRPGTPE